MIFRFIMVIVLAAMATGCWDGAPAAAPSRAPITLDKRPPLSLGLNIGGTAWYSNNRIYANLMLGYHWQMAVNDGNWQGVPPELMDPDGWLKSLPPGGKAFRSMNHPNFTEEKVDIMCRYTGKGKLDVVWHGLITDRRWGKDSFRFRWQTMAPRDDRDTIANIYLEVTEVDPADPIRNIDCREATLDSKARFNPAFLAMLRGFSVVRYLGVMNQTPMPVLTWDMRKRLTTASVETGDGMPVEDLVQLANEAGVSPWFTIPYEADDDYQRHFAEYVHANLDPKLVAHVELSNEVWNSVFWDRYARAENEGKARNLAIDNYTALFRRYAQRTTEVMKIWTGIFADRPKSLVRIAATQQAYPDSSEHVLGFKDTANWVDALATAPYFAFDKTKYPLDSGLDNIFKGIDASIDIVLTQTDQHRAIADRHGVRFITYEAGQHIVLKDDIALVKAINRNPRMEAAYRRYIDGWAKRNGDMIVLMQDVSGIGSDGAWGLYEYLGQPLAQAPKARAALGYLNKASK